LNYLNANGNIFAVLDLSNNYWLNTFYAGNNDSLREVIFPDSMYNYNWLGNSSSYEPSISNIDIYNTKNLRYINFSNYILC
jgi:hypothetical protein